MISCPSDFVAESPLDVAGGKDVGLAWWCRGGCVPPVAAVVVPWLFPGAFCGGLTVVGATTTVVCTGEADDPADRMTTMIAKTALTAAAYGSSLGERNREKSGGQFTAR